MTTNVTRSVLDGQHMPQHPLDNPVWAALQYPLHRSLSTHGNPSATAAVYHKDVAPFAGTMDGSSEAAAELTACVPLGQEVYTVGPVPDLIQHSNNSWQHRGESVAVQMVYDGVVMNPVLPTATHAVSVPAIRQLTLDDVDQLLTLTSLTYGQFFRPRTIEMGDWFGTFNDEGQLVAMAGERLHMFNYIELSGIITHPDYRGRGFAAALMTTLVNRAQQRGLIPCLHVTSTNTGAIRLYERHGFRKRRELSVRVFKRMGA